MKRGTLILVIGPSGSGKNTLIAYARAVHPDLYYPVSCTTREKRAGEEDGREYHFLSRAEFEQRIAAGDFLEWAEYGGSYYGTLHSEIDAPLAEGRIVLSDIEVQGVRQLRARLPKEELAVVFIDAGSWEELAARITARAPMSEDELMKRRLRYEDECTEKAHADAVVENRDGGLEEAKAAFLAVIERYRENIRSI